MCKNFTVAVPLLMLLCGASSCTTYKSLRTNEAIDSAFLTTLKTKKRYAFKLKSGLTQRIRLTDISEDQLSGYVIETGEAGVKSKVPYHSSFLEVTTYVDEISMRRIHGEKTTLLIAWVASTVILIVVVARNGFGGNVGF
jgi:hypothetical protein